MLQLELENRTLGFVGAPSLFIFQFSSNFRLTTAGSPFKRQFREWALQERSSEDLPLEWAG
jgi:hypothetical protein